MISGQSFPATFFRATSSVHGRRLALTLAFLLAPPLLAACGTTVERRDPPAPSPTPEPVPAYTLAILNGKIVDGTGNGWFRGDIAVDGDRIIRVVPAGFLDAADAAEVIDATHLVVAPGFIDINGQSDNSLFSDGRALNKLFQGVTTEIMGESNTPGPVNARILGSVNPRDSVAVRRSTEWRRFGGWLEEMEASGVALNVGSFLGGTTVRRYVMGFEDRPPTPAEVDSMKAVVARSMEDGAMGVATALIYPPGSFAGTDELVEIARTTAAHGGIYVSHIRSESYLLLEALDEAIEIGARSGAPVEIYHLKAAGVDNWPLGRAAAAKIDSARAAGLDISAGMYPYTAAATSLNACLPPWTSADDRLRQNLQDPVVRERIVSEVLGPPADWENWCRLATPEGSLITGVSRPEHQRLQGMTLAELAAEKGTNWIDAAMDLILAENGRVGMVYFAMSEENVRDQLSLPWMKFGSDAGSWDPARATSMTHPRAYGTYPRILGKYVREEGALPLEDAVRKMTSAVADRVGLRDRGQLREGFVADIVVFDEHSIAELSTFTDPHRLSTGVLHLVVNGEPVIRDGDYTGALPGRFVKGRGWRPEAVADDRPAAPAAPAVPVAPPEDTGGDGSPR